ncbi:Pkinase-domain-containing protein, partial [Aureobasidium melanogenum]
SLANKPKLQRTPVITFLTAPRPLPALPTDTPNTFITRTLEETRHKLAARSASEGNDGSAKIEQVLANLDRIMPGDKRAVSAPDHHLMDNRAPLPIISEEGRSEGAQGRPNTAHRYRSVTAPMPERTVRMVQPSSPATPNSPYNWRSVEEPVSDVSQHTVIDKTRLTVPTVDPRMVRKKSSDSDVPLSQISSQGSHEGAVKKKSSWFRKWKEPSAAIVDDSHVRPRSPMQWNETAGQPGKPSVLNRDNRPPHLDLTNAQVSAPKSSSSSEFPMRRESKGFSKWFGRKKDSDK